MKTPVTYINLIGSAKYFLQYMSFLFVEKSKF